MMVEIRETRDFGELYIDPKTGLSRYHRFDVLTIYVEKDNFEDDEASEMASLQFNGLRWEVSYYDTTDASEEPQHEYLDSYEEAMDFLTMRLVLARML